MKKRRTTSDISIEIFAWIFAIWFGWIVFKSFLAN